MLSVTVRLVMGRRKRAKLAAMDSTGLESGQISPYYVKRRSRDRSLENVWQTTTYTCFPKLGVVCDCATHLILSCVQGIGPRPDVDQLAPLMNNMTGQVIPDQLLLDAGYDSENNHKLLRESLGIESVIPPTAGRPTDKLATSKWRWLMATAFDEDSYGQRWQAETVMHMLNRARANLSPPAATTPAMKNSA